MNFISNLFLTSLQQVGLSLLHNWPYLLVGIIISAILKVYVDTEKISAFLRRFRGMGVLAATGVAVGTPLCSCGTTAVVLGMMASTMPWAPIVAFMVSSPLTSPEGLFYSAGLFGWPFAWSFFLASILLGLAGGGAAALLENWGWLANQTRFTTPTLQPQTAGCGCDTETQPVTSSQPAVSSCGCLQTTPMLAQEMTLIPLDSLQPVAACACAAAPVVSPSFRPALPVKLATLLREIYNSGRQLLPMFVGFAFIGFFLNGLIPASWVTAIFGSGNIYSVPLAATLGLPFYINAEGSLPLIRALLDNGMSQGAALAFLIAGSGTSLGAIAGALTIARWRVVGLVIGVLWVGAILSGYAYDLLLASRVF
jgi:uncharacterized membrane protein YraQ (UPF0718 family)